MITRAWGGGQVEMGRWWPKGTQFQLCKRNKFWDPLYSTVPMANNTVYLQFAQRIDLLLNVFIPCMYTHTNNDNNGGKRKLWEVMGTFVALLRVTVYTYPQTHWIVHVKYVQLFTCNHSSIQSKRKRKPALWLCKLRGHRGGWKLIYVWETSSPPPEWRMHLEVTTPA